MSVLLDCMELKAAIEKNDSKEVTPSIPEREMKDNVGTSISFVPNWLKVIADLFRGNGDTTNSNARKGPYDYVHVRGLR